MAEWVWNVGSARYHDLATGRFMARSEVLGYVDQSLAASGAATDLLTQFVTDATLSPMDWQAVMREEIKKEYIRQYILGRGGIDQMTQADWGSIGGMLKREYRYLDDFSAEIATGELSEAQIRARSRMYVNGAREAFDRADTKSAEIAGMKEERWVVNPAIENCPDCLAFQAEGWQPLGYFPAIASGATQCLSNCGCHKEFRTVESEG